MDTMPRRSFSPPTAIAADPLDLARRLLDEGEPSLADLASHTGLSASHLQRRFRARFGLSPAEYLARKKLGTLKAALREGRDVTTALYDAGYGSPSRLYEQGAAKLGMTPATYRAGGRGVAIRWTLVDTVLGRTLVAATDTVARAVLVRKWRMASSKAGITPKANSKPPKLSASTTTVWVKNMLWMPPRPIRLLTAPKSPSSLKPLKTQKHPAPCVL